MKEYAIILIAAAALAGICLSGCTARNGAAATGAQVLPAVQEEEIKRNEGITLWNDGVLNSIALFRERSGSDMLFTVRRFAAKSSRDLTITYMLEYQKPIWEEAPITTLPVLDMLARRGEARLLVQDNADIVYVEAKPGSDPAKPSVKRKSIYRFKWTPSLNAGRVTEARFLADDVVKIANSTGAEYVFRLNYTKKGAPYASMVWKNGRGEPFTSALSYPDDKPEVSGQCPQYKFSFAGFDRLSDKARDKKFQELDKNADILKVEDGPSELSEDVNIVHMKQSPLPR